MSAPLDIVILGLSITSSWGNGHATTFRALMRELDRAGHHVLFLERDVPWYADNRDLARPPYGRTELYQDLEDLQSRFGSAVRDADAVIVGSYVPEGIAVGDWVQATAMGITAFYDIDTPVTLARLASGDCEYLTERQIPRYDRYLSFTGGPVLERLENDYGAPSAHALYCSVDPELYYPEAVEPRWDLGYLGTWAADRQPVLDRLLLEPANRRPEGRYVLAGPLYPPELEFPASVERIEHLPPHHHRRFYRQQRFTLNATRSDMVAAGWSPSVRLFEAAACGTPVISDWWDGIETLFEPGKEILIAHDTDEVLGYLSMAEPARIAIGEAARRRVLLEHTSAHRATELEQILREGLHQIAAGGGMGIRPGPRGHSLQP